MTNVNEAYNEVFTLADASATDTNLHGVAVVHIRPLDSDAQCSSAETRRRQRQTRSPGSAALASTDRFLVAVK